MKLIEFDDYGFVPSKEAKHLAEGITQKTETQEDKDGKPQTIYYHTYYLPRDYYVEFAFEFDVVTGTDYPYSDVFWNAEQSANERVDTILIDLGGSTRRVNITIKVNNKEVVSKTNCDAHAPKYFKQDDRIRIKTYKTTSYSLNAQKVYGRKSSTGPWTCLLSEKNGDHETHISDSDGYVEFGFEFDVVAGRDWPYSGVSWTAAQSEKEKVEDIYIKMTGTTLDVDIDIYVNNKNIYSKKDLPSGLQYKWK